MHPTKVDLSEQMRIHVVGRLNQALADLIDLQLQAKQAHWNVRGPNFILDVDGSRRRIDPRSNRPNR